MNNEASVEAPLNPMWSAKWIAAAVVLLAVAGWSFYDGAVKYPRQQARYETFRELAESGRPHRWPEVAEERGWSTEKPGEDEHHSDLSILMQWAMGWTLTGAGLAALGRWLWYRGSRLAIEDGTLVGPRGRRVPLEAIRSIDKEKWEPKGIAVVHYEHEGSTGRVKLDEWMFPEAERVLTELEQQTGLVGDPVGV